MLGSAAAAMGLAPAGGNGHCADETCDSLLAITSGIAAQGDGSAEGVLPMRGSAATAMGLVAAGGNGHCADETCDSWLAITSGIAAKGDGSA